jgi:hypothetical protein
MRPREPTTAFNVYPTDAVGGDAGLLADGIILPSYDSVRHPFVLYGTVLYSSLYAAVQNLPAIEPPWDNPIRVLCVFGIRSDVKRRSVVGSRFVPCSA